MRLRRAVFKPMGRVRPVMPSTGATVWAVLFLLLPVVFLAAALTTLGGDPVAVFAALAWLVLGALLTPFLAPARA